MLTRFKLINSALALLMVATTFVATPSVANSDDSCWLDCLVYHPICADNGRTYMNLCLANKHGHQYAYEGACVSCAADTDCPNSMTCGSRGTCLPYTAPQCQVDSDCGAGNVCIDGTCYAGPQCQVDTDCPAGDVCQGGMCVPGVTPQCQVDTDCPAGNVCQNGTCVASVGSQCTVDADCAQGQVCNGGFCVDQGACLTDADCGPGKMCLGGMCYDAPTCAADTDCPTGYTCQNGLCAMTQGM